MEKCRECGNEAGARGLDGYGTCANERHAKRVERVAAQRPVSIEPGNIVDITVSRERVYRMKVTAAINWREELGWDITGEHVDGGCGTVGRVGRWKQGEDGGVVSLVGGDPLWPEWGASMATVPRRMMWGARAILTDNGEVDLLHDRQGMTGGDDDAERRSFCAVINAMLVRVRRQARDMGRDSNEVVEFEHDGAVVRFSPRQSHGYLYIFIAANTVPTAGCFTIVADDGAVLMTFQAENLLEAQSLARSFRVGRRRATLRCCGVIVETRSANGRWSFALEEEREVRRKVARRSYY